MTTTVTVKTHTWPVRVTITAWNRHETPVFQTSGSSTSTQFQAAHSEGIYYVSATASIAVDELPENAMDLNGSCLLDQMPAPTVQG
jgi:hypothetical protein